jgi:long-subunit acyl-CoA synthetase (AMP-forming)
MRRAGARALIHDNSFSNILGDSPVFTHVAEDVRHLDLQNIRLPPLLDVTPEDLVFIFHTSGSTSGSPKLVPAKYRWLSSALEKSYHLGYPRSSHRQDVAVFMCVIHLSTSRFDLIEFSSTGVACVISLRTSVSTGSRIFT